jgi:L-ascorbate metabolism protein UlaG (beta-lactamase superfamily)
MIFRWLGAAGIELRVGDNVLAIDPFFTRPPLWRIFFARVSPEVNWLAQHLPPPDHVLITHSHYDHVLDAAAVLRYSRAQSYGSLNACRLMVVMGAPEENVHEINAGDHLDLGPFSVDVQPLVHRRTPIDRWINGDLPKVLKAPLRLLDYRMDVCFGFRIEVDRRVLLVGDLPLEADILFTVPMNTLDHYEWLLDQVKPKLVVPIHWDDFFRPLNKRILPMLKAPKLTWPPLERVNLGDFKHEIESLSKHHRLLVPKIFETYQLEDETVEKLELEPEIA